MPGSSAPVQSGVRRRRNTQPVMANTSNDSSVVKYNVQSATIGVLGTTGSGAYRRLYIPGYLGPDLLSNAGSSVCSFYSTGVFKPGTSIKWEPSCSFTTSGRVFVGFTDNPEVAVALGAAWTAFITTPTTGAYNAFANQVKALGSTVSFPIWQETQIPFPMRLRRKRFDADSVPSGLVDNLDRNMQTSMWVAIEAGPATAQTVGNFWFHDVVDVEGLISTAT